MNRSIMATRKPFVSEAPPIVITDKGRKLIIDAHAANYLSNSLPFEIVEAFKPITNPDEFINGYRQAEDGMPHRSGMSAEFNRGYGARMEWEAIMGDIRHGNH